MKVYVLPADRYGCGHYRIVWPSQILRRMGINVSIMPPHKDSGFLAKTGVDDHGIERLVSLGVPEDADVIVLQRPAHPLQPEMIRMLRQNKIAVVVDMDDDMSTIHPLNSAFHLYRPSSGTILSWRHASESCKEATLVTTSTKALLKVYAKHGRGIVLDNYVPAAYLGFPGTSDNTFGWAGTTKSHPDDLQTVGKAADSLINEGFRFIVVGGDKGVKSALRLSNEPDMTGTVPIIDWASTIGKTISVGMIPLAPTVFNTSKSRLKGIEMASVGVPWVASPREEYRRLVKESGAGLLAETPKQWYAQLKTLLTDEVRRKELSEAGKAYMADQTYEAQAWRWAEAWSKAYEMERG